MNHIRATKFIYLFLYKNIVFTVAQFCFGAYCYWSAESIYDDWYIINYNLIFTAFTITYIGTFDQDVRFRQYVPSEVIKKKSNLPDSLRNDDGEETPSEAEDMESVIPSKATKVIRTIKNNFQHFYYITQKGLYYSMRLFYEELLLGCLQSVLLTVVAVSAFNRWPIDAAGHNSDIWCVSFSIYAVLICSLNVMVLLRASHVTNLLLLTLVFSSMVPFLLWMWFYDRWVLLNYYSTYSARFILQTPIFYLVVLICIFGVCFAELFRFFSRFYLSPTMVEYALKLEKSGIVEYDQYFTQNIIWRIKSFHVKKFRKNVSMNGRANKLVRSITMS